MSWKKDQSLFSIQPNAMFICFLVKIHLIWRLLQQQSECCLHLNSVTVKRKHSNPISFSFHTLKIARYMKRGHIYFTWAWSYDL